MEYKVKLEIFEGPLDLLLHLIKDNEIDIYDIPIAEITAQYLEYLEVMRGLNLDIAGDFLVMAAELARVKSKMLLPSPETDGDEPEEEIDPREELVKRLIEYKKYKDAAERLKNKELYQRELFVRENVLTDTENKNDELISDISVFDLICAFKDIMKKISSEFIYEVAIDEVSVSDRLNQIQYILDATPDIRFESLFTDSIKRLEVIATFLAILELIRQKLIKVYQVKQFGTIRIVRND